MTGAADRGLFGPDSASWRVDREVLVLAGGSCALLRHVPAARSAERRLRRAGPGR